MKTISSKKELVALLSAGVKHIRVVGPLAGTISKMKKVGKVTRVASVTAGAAAVVGGIVAIPFTAGASAMGAVAGAGAIAAGLTVGTFTISAAELLILCGASVTLLAVLKGRNVKVTTNRDGSATLDVD